MTSVRSIKKYLISSAVAVASVLMIAFMLILPLHSLSALASSAPSATPEGISMTYYADPYTTRGFAWSTDQTITDSVLQVIEAKQGEALNASEFDTTRAVTVKGSRTPSGDYMLHKAHITDLKEDTRYFWRVGSVASDSFSDPSEFQTGVRGENTSFLHLTDAQEASEINYKLWGNVLDAAFKTQPDTDFVAFTGDMVNDSHSKIEMQQWIWALDQAPRLRANVIMPAAGNHESGGTSFADRFDIKYAGSLHTGAYYAFEYGNVHMITLNTNESGNFTIQYQWLENELKNSTARWIVVQMHKGLVSTGDHTHDGDVKQLRTQLMPLFAKYGVDLVLQGHDHVYTRSVPYFNGIDADGNDYDGKTPNLAPEKRFETIGEDRREFDIEPDGTYYVTINYAGTKQYPPVAYDTSIIFPAVHNGATMSVQPGYPMFGAVRTEDNKLVYDAYIVKNGAAEIYDSFAVLKDTFESVDRAIESLPVVPTVMDARELAAVSEKYDALTASAKRRLKPQNATKLATALQRVNLTHAIPALSVIEEINALTDVSTQKPFRDRLATAEKNYYMLLSESRALVSNFDRIESLKAEVLDRTFSEGVERLISSIDGDSVKRMAARLTYDNLTERQKSFVRNISELEAAEQTVESGCTSTVIGSRVGGALSVVFILCACLFVVMRKRHKIRK